MSNNRILEFNKAKQSLLERSSNNQMFTNKKPNKTEFAQMTFLIAKEINSVTLKLTKLSTLAKKKVFLLTKVTF